MAANAAETGHPATRLAAQIAGSAASLENLLVPVPRDRLVHGPWPEDLTAADRATLLPHLGKALTHLGMCAEAIAAEPGIRGEPRNSLQLVGHLLGRAAGELDALNRGALCVPDAGRRPAVPSRDVPDPAVPDAAAFPAQCHLALPAGAAGTHPGGPRSPASAPPGDEMVTWPASPRHSGDRAGPGRYPGLREVPASDPAEIARMQASQPAAAGPAWPGDDSQEEELLP